MSDSEDDIGRMSEDQEDEEQEDTSLPTDPATLKLRLQALERFSFKPQREIDDDATGHYAFEVKCQELDKEEFYRFPIDSVLRKIDSDAVNLRRCGLGDKGCMALAECLKINSSITSLTLTDNGISPSGADALFNAIAVNKSIRFLNISHNNLGSRAMGVDSNQTCGAMVQRVLLKNNVLQQLNLSSNRLTDRDVKPISEGIQANTSLTAIDLSYNELGPRGGLELAELIAHGDLKEINIEWNQLGYQGTMAVLRDGILGQNTIRKFVMAWNGINDEGGEILGKIIEACSALEECDVSHNRIGPKGGESIAKGIKLTSSLTKIILAENPLRDEGCAAIIRAVRENKSLTQVDLRATDAGRVAAEELKETLAQKTDEFVIEIPRSLFLPTSWGLDNDPAVAQAAIKSGATQ